MIFKPEMVEKILAGEKTVTRRPVKYERIQPFGGFTELVEVARACRYEVGKDYAVQPVIEEGPGKGRGGKEVARLFVVRIAREPLGGGLDRSISEAEREGFEDWPAFVLYWQGLYGSYDPNQLVDRIEFERVEANQREGGE